MFSSGHEVYNEVKIDKEKTRRKKGPENGVTTTTVYWPSFRLYFTLNGILLGQRNITYHRNLNLIGKSQGGYSGFQVTGMIE